MASQFRRYIVCSNEPTSTERAFCAQIFIQISVTRFGEISPLWHKIKCLWQFCEGLFSIWQKVLPTLVNTIGQFFMVVNRQIMKTKKLSRHHTELQI